MPRKNPQPWFRKSRNTWYVTIDGVQHNLHTAVKDEAYDRWHKLMAGRDEAEPSETSPEMEVAHLWPSSRTTARSTALRARMVGIAAICRASSNRSRRGFASASYGPST